MMVWKSFWYSHEVRRHARTFDKGEEGRAKVGFALEWHALQRNS